MLSFSTNFTSSYFHERLRFSRTAQKHYDHRLLWSHPSVRPLHPVSTYMCGWPGEQSEIASTQRICLLCLSLPSPSSHISTAVYSLRCQTEDSTKDNFFRKCTPSSQHFITFICRRAVTSSCCDVISCLPLLLKLRSNICRLVYALISWLLCRRKQKHARALTTVVRRDDWR